jgi:hypothetical protein
LAGVAETFNPACFSQPRTFATVLDDAAYRAWNCAGVRNR